MRESRTVVLNEGTKIKPEGSCLLPKYYSVISNHFKPEHKKALEAADVTVKYIDDETVECMWKDSEGALAVIAEVKRLSGKVFRGDWNKSLLKDWNRHFYS